ncbi:MAG: DUF1330 domain-containing protein [Halieaceae bacterium]|jgi:uncharacterized protein (DUF1330 family)|nr:DUF1330 domain-containing protein [Halieaceae bacterium]
MPAYLLANYTITNPDGYADYPPSVAPTLEPFGGELVVADFSSEAVEGSPAPVSIVVKFPDRNSARAWYDSEAYQAVIGLRRDNSEGFLAFVDGIV